MQKLLFIPLGLALGGFAGCTPSTDSAASTNSDDYIVNSKPQDAAAKSITNSAVNMASKAPAKAPAKASTKVVAKSPAAPKSPYRIVDLDAEMPPELAAAMKKFVVPPPPANYVLPKNPRVRLVTSKGAVTVQLDPKAAPLHARSFYYLAKRGFFNNTVFHRFADLTGDGGNIIQGGDPLTSDPKLKEMWGSGGPGYAIPREHNALKHDKLVIAAARTSDPNSAGSGFYITQNPVYFLDEGDGYTVFGKVVDGQSVALKLRQDDSIEKAIALP